MAKDWFDVAMEKGEQQGIQRERQNVVLKLIKNKVLTNEEIAKTIDIPLEEVEIIAKQA